MAMMAMMALAISVALCHGQSQNAFPFDPRHHFDKRCPAAVVLDPVGKQRDPSSSSIYKTMPLSTTATFHDCAIACCGDWSCEAFTFTEAKQKTGALSGSWFNHDLLRGVSKLNLEQAGQRVTAQSLEPRSAFWSTALGEVDGAGFNGYLVFDQNPMNNRTFQVSGDGNIIVLSRLGTDPPGFTQNFTRSDAPFGPTGPCKAEQNCCSFRDDIDALATGEAGVRSGVRSKLRSYDPPASWSTSILNAVLIDKMYLGINGDEFPITWGRDGNQYTGAGDNQQVGLPDSPLSFFKVAGGPKEMGCDDPRHQGGQPSPTCKNITQQGPSIVVGTSYTGVCPEWRSGIPNLKSSAVLSLDGVLYWAISCFNYGDDPVFDRQRYGPAWIITSHDNGVTWNVNATSPNMFPGRLAAPRFVQYGQDNEGAPDDWVYTYFPGTTDGTSFFENNDQMLLGRVNKFKILDRSAYQFFNGVLLDGTDSWTSDSSIAVPVWSHPLMTSVQQVNYHKGAGRYIFANWAWISYDGYPRPDHTPDERNQRTGHQRTQLLLLESPTPWGPFSVFYRTDDWAGDDGSVGGYTPVIPPAWIGATDFWLVFTQCCGNPRPPLNNYNFNAQHVTFKLAAGAQAPAVVI